MESKKVISDWFYQYSNDIFHFFIYRMGTLDVEDLVQEVFIKAIKGIDSFKGTSSPKTWLYSIARNVAVDELRKKKRNKWKEFLSLNDKHESATKETPETILQLNEENKRLFQAIQSLHETYRDILIIRGIKGLTTEEAAEILKWSKKKVHTTYHRAKIALQKELREIDDEL
ncbi:RNA polymerase sigma factor [Bacillus gobiensis]|uniref:RNA polymerase sigma factor n=1 Tax=Bacillus gobiensis TaxID=1441095 RepID=UPI003D1F11FD